MHRSGNRRGTRIKTRFQTLYTAKGQEGSALLAEISYSGARLEGTAFKPALGTRVCIYVWLQKHAEPFELAGKVVRHTEQGFAIEYEKPGQDICLMVDAAAALVTQLDEAQLESAARADPNARRPEPTAWRVEPAAPSPQAPRLGASLAELDLSRYGMQELKEHAARLEAAIARKQVEAKERIRSEMAKLASEEGLTLEEVLAAKRVDPG